MPSAVVTGGASGIGAACVAILQEDGYRVAVIDRELAPAADVAVTADVADEAAMVDAVVQAVGALGAPAIAVLAAGVGGFGPIVELTTAEWDRVMTVNLRGAFVSMREIAKAMIAADAPGSIVAVSSVSACTADSGLAHYCASKAGLDALVAVASRELGRHGIRVNAVAPGTTDTPMFAATDVNPGFRDRVERRTALGRIGTADDVAEAVIAVAHATWITGQRVVADGGLSRFSPLDPLDAG